MLTLVRLRDIPSGCELTRLDFFRHKGIHLGDGWVFECSKLMGPQLVRIEDFARGYRVQFRRLSVPVRELWRRANWIIDRGQPYDAIFNNCEHNASLVATGKSSSPQVQGALAMSILALLISVGIRNDGRRS